MHCMHSLKLHPQILSKPAQHVKVGIFQMGLCTKRHLRYVSYVIVS